MVSQKVKIKNPTGLHLRPAGVLCNKALEYKCTTEFIFGSYTGNAKSILSVLAACVKCGDEIELRCNGDDEKEALQDLVYSIETGLGE